MTGPLQALRSPCACCPCSRTLQHTACLACQVPPTREPGTSQAGPLEAFSNESLKQGRHRLTCCGRKNCTEAGKGAPCSSPRIFCRSASTSFTSSVMRSVE